MRGRAKNSLEIDRQGSCELAPLAASAKIVNAGAEIPRQKGTDGNRENAPAVIHSEVDGTVHLQHGVHDVRASVFEPAHGPKAGCRTQTLVSPPVRAVGQVGES